MRLPIKIATGIAAAAVFVAPLVSSAAQLTSDQVNAVVSLLQSFNVDTKTVETVKATLTNTPLPPQHDEDKDDENDDDKDDKSDNKWKLGSTTPGLGALRSCPKILRNLSVGAQGEDVKSLQALLAADPSNLFKGTTTGYYGPLTAQAVMRFQEKHRIASSSTGIVGPLTRTYMRAYCDRIPNPLTPLPPPQVYTNPGSPVSPAGQPPVNL